ncbi:hypothetical protein O181_102747 [Austropuccinia psidii MF-1]|uniref:Uncharacterized protein n=1 Tax=Austropuccinia psidii MF-1 TaxID=1389203 RepID=A0A9Q3PJS5_9BASI|nr:hypothetical protein [Austropuccinia psidii MF-1]
MHVSEDPGSTPEISSKANPQFKFPCELLLNPGWNPVASQDPFGQSKQPTLNIQSGSQVHVGNEKRVDGGQQKRPLENVTRSGLSEGNPGLMLHQNMAPKGKSVLSQEPIEDRETGHASSSREKIVDDEDENMSPTQSERNDEPRRDNFTAHEQGTQSNSEFTHPQMGPAQSMLEQSKVRQQRIQACKSHNVVKHAIQKEQQNWLRSELPENVHGMRSAVHAHCLFLLKVRDKDFSSLPAPPSTEECEIAIQVAGHLGYVPKDVFSEPSTQVQFQGFQRYCKKVLHKLGLKQFTWDWERSWQHLFSKLMSMVFYHTFHPILVSTEYHHYCWNKDHNKYGVVAPLMEQYFTYLKREWKSIQKHAQYLVKKKENQKLAKICQRVGYCISCSL